MKTKKIMYRVASTAMCLTLLGAGAQVFAATSDSYTGYTYNGSASTRITCKINGFDNPFGRDSCTASTQSDAAISVRVIVCLYNSSGVELNAAQAEGIGNASAKVTEISSNSTAYAQSLHYASDDIFGQFLRGLQSDFSQ